MKKLVPSLLLALAVLMVVLSGCAPASTPAPTAVAPTLTATPLPPTNTSEPTATNTLEPTATPIVLPDPLNSTFSNVSIVYRESFESANAMDGALPAGWEAEDPFAVSITKDNQLYVQPETKGDWSGTVFWFSQEPVTSNTGVYFTFKYAGNSEAFTLGLDSVTRNGERIPNGEAGFHSVAMQLEPAGVSAHIIRGGWQNSTSFSGGLLLKEDTWYEIALGLDDTNNYIIKIWQPETPRQSITYFRKWDDFPRDYYFISWISAKRSLLIDDFTVFTFDEITSK